MIEKLTTSGVAPVRETQRTERPRANTQRVQSDPAPTAIPASPPPEVLAALDEGARVIKELSDSRVELHFAIEDAAAGKRVRIQVREAGGEVVREIPASKLLDILAGEARGLTVDAIG